MYKFLIRDPHFLPHCGCDIDLQVEKGDLITLVGENGVGKSTLARRIHQDHLSLLAYLQQGPMDLFYDRPLKKLKEIYLSVSHGEVSEKFFLELWDGFNLSRKEDRLQSSLSGGESQALKICLGLSVERNLYLLDEPSQFLDTASKEFLSQKLQELISLGKTVIMIEHDLTWIKGPMKVSELGIEDCYLRIRSSWTT